MQAKAGVWPLGLQAPWGTWGGKAPVKRGCWAGHNATWLQSQHSGGCSRWILSSRPAGPQNKNLPPNKKVRPSTWVPKRPSLLPSAPDWDCAMFLPLTHAKLAPFLHSGLCQNHNSSKETLKGLNLSISLSHAPSSVLSSWGVCFIVFLTAFLVLKSHFHLRLLTGKAQPFRSAIPSPGRLLRPFGLHLFFLLGSSSSQLQGRGVLCDWFKMSL